MVGSRKRKIGYNKTLSNQNVINVSLNTPIKRDLLDQYYPQVRTLREHLLSKLPESSRIRRKKLETLGSKEGISDLVSYLAHVLDSSLVCTRDSSPSAESQQTRWQQWLSFSQKGDESYVTISDGIPLAIASQAEIVDFVVWLLFSREKGLNSWPKNLLCDGFRRNPREGQTASTTIPGIYSVYPNFHVRALKEAPWPHLLALLGQAGEKVMIDLLVDCSIFLKVEAGLNNYFQLGGLPFSELEVPGNLNSQEAGAVLSRKQAEIIFVRSRIFYAKPAVTAKGLIQPGYKHIHALNRLNYVPRVVGSSESPEMVTNAELKNEIHTIRLMMYIFPRQFGLHNVFTSETDTTQTAQKFHDYTLREEDISRCMGTKNQPAQPRLPKIPKRLRGQPLDLVRRLQILHNRCSYFELLRHYCPAPVDHTRRLKKRDTGQEPITHEAQSTRQPLALSNISQSLSQVKKQARKFSTGPQSLRQLDYESLVELACPHSHVSAFCQAVLSKIIPDAFWGSQKNCHNKTVFLCKVDHFIKLRRFESVSLHEITQGIKITDLDWLQPPSLGHQRMSQTDMQKRLEIFNEFMYYVFDSLLIPLIRSNFYVTESNTHRLQVFYFRHDVWRLIAEPAMSNLKSGMFEEIKLDEAKRVLDSRRLGFSQLRLLPKGTKLRPIMNLRRRQMGDGTAAKVLGPSINTVLGPIHTALKLEKDIDPSKLGSALFAVGDIYDRLKSFKESIGDYQQTFYFAKLDVKAAFDTIPQASVLKLMSTIPTQKQYVITKHAEVKSGERKLLTGNKATTKPFRRWHATAVPQGQPTSFIDRLENGLGSKRKNTVFVDSAALKSHDVRTLMTLLAEHVGQNIVKIGKKYYRQKRGIPQGSVLSSFLCNYFYADLEAQHLSFLGSSDCLLMRLIDDFLLITTDKSKAIKFVETMHQGLPEYGVEVGHEKTLVNFDMSINGSSVRRIANEGRFPYCGMAIDCRTLEIMKDREKDKGLDLHSTLTVEFSRTPGQTFQRKVLNAFKIQSHLMLFDTALNSTVTVLTSLRDAFRETASKMWAYIRCLSTRAQPSTNLIIRTIQKVADTAFLTLTSKWRKMRRSHYTCDIRRVQVTSIAFSTFLEVLSRKQTRYGRVIEWLRGEVARLGTDR